jgi:hypothetical protein
MNMSLDLKKSLELQKWILGISQPEVRNCRFDNKPEAEAEAEKLVAKSAGIGETVVYPGTEDRDKVRKQLELQRMILDN